MPKGRFFLGTMAAAAAGLLAACRVPEVRLLVLLPLSGPQAAYGRSLHDGARLGEEAVNAAGGVRGRKLVLAVKDSGGDGPRAVRVLEDWAHSPGCRLVVGGATSEEALALAPVAERSGLLLLSPSASSPLLSGRFPHFFRTWPSDAVEARGAAEFLAYSLHATTVLVVVEPGPYGEGLAGAFRGAFEDGLRRAETRTAGGDLPPGDPAPPGIQAFFLAGRPEALLPWLEGVRALGDDRVAVASSAFGVSGLTAPSPAACDGLCVVAPEAPGTARWPEAAAFEEAFERRFGRHPDRYARSAYDAVRVAAAAAGAGKTAEELRLALLSLKKFSGASGPIAFGPGGDLSRPAEVLVCRGGGLLPLREVSPEFLTGLQERVARRRLGGKR
ncbi:MAG: ABC transporter substrate-binding protein [Acidobacteriota bacterium]